MAELDDFSYRKSKVLSCPDSQERFNAWVLACENNNVALHFHAHNAQLCERLSTFLGSSEYAYQWALKFPEWMLDIVSVEPLQKSSLESSEVIYQELLEQLTNIANDSLNDATEFDIKRWLRHQRHFWSLRFYALQIFAQLPLSHILFLQSELAFQLISVAKNWCQSLWEKQHGVVLDAKAQRQELLILAMGKLGGYELNFSSDIDLIFCYPEEAMSQLDGLLSSAEVRVIDAQKYFTRMGQKLIALLNENTADGFVYRVDMRLRPYGQSGALAINLDAFSDYYLEQGREWERFAMIKAKIIADSENYRKAIENIIKPFSFRRYIDFSVLDAIRQLKQKIAIEVRNRNKQRDIKLGTGGIRELEFIVQSLQLISGGRYPSLQCKNWRKALYELQALNLIDNENAKKLELSYHFLRHLENHLQAYNNEQTQSIPECGNRRKLLAKNMGYPSWEVLDEQLGEQLNYVEQFFKALFHDNNKPDHDESLHETIKNLYAIESLNEDEEAFLTDNNINLIYFNKVSNFYRKQVLDKLAARSRQRMNELLPVLIILASKKRQENALERVLDILQAIGRRSAYFELLAENLPLLEYLLDLCGRSKWLAQKIGFYPSLLDELLFPSNFGKKLSKQDFSEHLSQLTLRIEPEQIEDLLLAIGRFKVASQFKVAVGYLSQKLSINEVNQQLTDIAELVLDFLLKMAWQEVGKRYGYPEHCSAECVERFMVVGYGKLGGNELGFGSDLDLVFIFDDESSTANAMTHGKKPIENSQFFTRLGQKLVHYLNARTQQGILYEVDTRLRPSGRSGHLVTSLKSFIAYQENDAWTWEKQAITRARAVAGCDNLKLVYSDERSKLLKKFSQSFSNENILDIHEMREKMRLKLDRSDAAFWDIKHGYGGLVDIEFLTQYFALKYATAFNRREMYSTQYWLANVKDIVEPDFADEIKFLMGCYQLLQSVLNDNKLQGESALIASDSFKPERERVRFIWSKVFSNIISNDEND